MAEVIGLVGKKFDDGKSPIYSGCFNYFARALRAVADISNYGFKKYGSWGGWRTVPDGLSRYTDADARHLISESFDGRYDPESKLLHAAHHAWNALARLELILQEQEEENVPSI